MDYQQKLYEEGVQIAVETGLILDTFTGDSIGIDERIRALSVEAIRTILQQNEDIYRLIIGVARYGFTISVLNATDSYNAICKRRFAVIIVIRFYSL